MTTSQIQKLLPGSIKITRGKRGHVVASRDGISYSIEKSRFATAQHIADLVATKLGGPASGKTGSEYIPSFAELEENRKDYAQGMRIRQSLIEQFA